jgi:hypothetical protein
MLQKNQTVNRKTFHKKSIFRLSLEPAVVAKSTIVLDVSMREINELFLKIKFFDRLNHGMMKQIWKNSNVMFVQFN